MEKHRQTTRRLFSQQAGKQSFTAHTVTHLVKKTISQNYSTVTLYRVHAGEQPSTSRCMINEESKQTLGKGENSPAAAKRSTFEAVYLTEE